MSMSQTSSCEGCDLQASCQYDRIDFGQPMWTTSCTSRISNPIPKATVAIMHRIRLLPLLNSVSILYLESRWRTKACQQ
jgi:hypothetical protein